MLTPQQVIDMFNVAFDSKFAAGGVAQLPNWQKFADLLNEASGKGPELRLTWDDEIMGSLAERAKVRALLEWMRDHSPDAIARYVKACVDCPDCKHLWGSHRRERRLDLGPDPLDESDWRCSQCRSCIDRHQPSPADFIDACLAGQPKETDDNEPGGRVHNWFHRQWSRAVDVPGYAKKTWAALDSRRTQEKPDGLTLEQWMREADVGFEHWSESPKEEPPIIDLMEALRSSLERHPHRPPKEEKPLTLEDVDRIAPGGEPPRGGYRRWFNAALPVCRALLRFVDADGRWARRHGERNLEFITVRTEADLRRELAWLNGDPATPPEAGKAVGLEGRCIGCGARSCPGGLGCGGSISDPDAHTRSIVDARLREVLEQSLKLAADRHVLYPQQIQLLSDALDALKDTP